MKQYQYLEHVITEGEDGLEVFYFLRVYWNLTIKKIRSVKFHEVGILLDGERVTVRKKVTAGQLLRVLLSDVEAKEDHVLPNPMPLEILYEDANMIFCNKPTGMVSHPSRGHLTDSLANGVKAHFEEQQEASHVHLIGRLDKDTSGIVGIAKNSVTADRMAALRKEGDLHKEYLALVTGRLDPSEGEITIPMEEHYPEEDPDRLIMRRASGKKPIKQAATTYKTIKVFQQYSLVRVSIETGRTHQIRFHMAEIGHPLLGDPIYGSGGYSYKEYSLQRSALHAWRVTMSHPFTGEKILLEAELPQDLKVFLDDGEDR